jgi:predicted ester cyclase
MRVSKTGLIIGIFCSTAMNLLVACTVETNQLPVPKVTVTNPGADSTGIEKTLLPARRYYAFWNSGDEDFARQALSTDFIDLKLPAGRPQGPEGPRFASRHFRQAVPDLSLSVERAWGAWVVDNQVISHLHFSGHFSGSFAGRKGNGRAISFDAGDIYTIRDGRITTDWHLEDNLALMKQLGVIAP